MCYPASRYAHLILAPRWHLHHHTHPTPPLAHGQRFIYELMDQLMIKLKKYDYEVRTLKSDLHTTSIGKTTHQDSVNFFCVG